MPEALAPEPVENGTAIESAFTNAAEAAPIESVAAPELTAPAAPEASPYLERAKSAGIPLDGIDSNEKLIDSLLEQFQKNQPYVQAGQHYLASPPHPQSPPEAEPLAKADEFDPGKYFAEKWNVPKWDDNFTRAIQAGWVQQDEAGKWVAVPGAEMLVAPLITPLNQAHAAKQQAVQSLFQGNFYEQLYTNLLEPLRREWSKDVQKNLGQYQQSSKHEQYVDQFEREHNAWLYKPGSRDYTDKGAALVREMETLKANGISDPQQLLAISLRLIGGPPAAQPAAPAAAPAAPVAPATPEAKSTAKKQSFLDNAAKRAGHSPQSRGYTQSSPSDPAVMSKGELETLFVREAAQSSSV